MVCEIFKNTFLTEHLCNCNFTKWGTANSVWKTSDEYSLSRNTNLRSTVQVYHFFLGSINSQFMFSLVYTVYCPKQQPECRCSMKKGAHRYFAKFTWNNLCQRTLSLGLRPATLLKKRSLWHRCFSVNFGKFLRTPFITEQL